LDDVPFLHDWDLAECRMIVREDGLVVFLYKEDVHVTLDIARDQNRRLREVLDMNQKYRLLVEPSPGMTIEKEAREFANHSDVTSLWTAHAVVISNLAHRIIANFILKQNFSEMKMKLFPNRQKAMQWLSEF
jgi:hypothetical protein